MERKSSAWPWRKKPEKQMSQLAPSPALSNLELDPSARAHGFHVYPFDKLEPQPQQMEIPPSPVAKDTIALVGHDGAEDTAKMLKQRILDVSVTLLEKEELASQKERITGDVVKAHGADLVAKDEQLKQHTTALKEEKSAREKAEMSYLSLKQELDKVCQQKISAEARMMQLNGALKDCMDEIRHAKSELEQRTQEMAFRQREWDKLRNELESETSQLKRQLIEATAENVALSKSFQERGRSLSEINETKAKVESESKILQVQIESLHKDIDAYVYEIHVLKKELQIRNDELEQNRKVSDATHKQHIENLKKIAKLDSECNRLRALVRKRLPGPAAVAQMWAEVDHVGKKQLSPSPKTSLDQRELDALTERLLAAEDETKLLKEALAKRTAELQAARQLCARTASKLSSAEDTIEAMAKGQSLPLLCNQENDEIKQSNKYCESIQQRGFVSTPAPPIMGGETMEVMDWAYSSEDGNNNDDEQSSAESWASALISELSHLRKNDGSFATKTDENNKCGIIPLVQHFDLQAAMQELNSKLSLIGESILALPSSMKNAGEQGMAIASKPLLAFGMLGQIMEQFTFVRQLLTEVQRATELERNRVKVVESDRSLQGRDMSADGNLMVINRDKENAKSAQADNVNGKRAYVGLVRKIIQALLVPVGSSSKQTESEAGGGEDVFICLQKEVEALGDGNILHDLSEEGAAKFVRKIGDFLKEQCMDNARIGEEAAPGNTGIAVVGDSEKQLIAGSDEDGGANEAGLNIDPKDSSAMSTKGTLGNDVDSVLNDKLDVDVGEGVGNGAEATSTEPMHVSSELCLQLEQLQHEVERLGVERDELAAKLVALERQLKQEQARVATLDAESLLLAAERESLARQLSDTSARNEELERDLSDARVCLDGLRQQVATFSAPRCHQQLQGNVGTSAKIDAREVDPNHRKKREIASARAQLAECQRTILVLDTQLRDLSSVREQGPSLDLSLRSGMPTDQDVLPPGPGLSCHVGAQSRSRQRRAEAGYVRTRGGRLVSAEQFWGSAGDIPAPGSAEQWPSPYADAGDGHAVLPRRSYGAPWSQQSPLHEYATERSAHVYSPPDTALSSPAGSPAMFSLQVAGGRSLKTLQAAMSPAVPPPLKAAVASRAVTAAGCPSPSPARQGSRIAKFFSRARTQKII